MRSGVIRENILELTKAFPDSVNNYNTLVFQYWVLFDGVDVFSQISTATPAETITRHFRKLVEQGYIKVAEKITKKRNNAEAVFRDEFSSLR